jgi:uncharacterized membrane protein (UPF0127 family)
VTNTRRAVAAAVALVLAAALVGGALVLVLREDDSPAPAGVLAGVLAGSRPATAPFRGLTEVQLSVGGDCLRTVVTDERDERAVGLMRRRELGPYRGMLFVFEGPTQGPFTMSDVPVPLDIGWYDDDGRLVDRLVMQPCPGRSPSECPSYRSRAPYRYAVETLEGGLPGGALSGCP